MKFDPFECEKYARMLLAHDEVERAILIIDNIPAYYRDHTPHNLVKLRDDILAAMITPHAYMSCDLDSDVNTEKGIYAMNSMLRGKMLLAEVKRYNDKGLTPHIVDVGPGEYFIPIGLTKHECKFTYFPLHMDGKAFTAAEKIISGSYKRKADPEQPTIFCALEIIEHLPSTMDLKIEAQRHCPNPDRVHISTPLYTYDVGHADWNKPCGLPHLRAYTPREIIAEAQRLFPNYHWHHYSDLLQSLRGMRADSIDAELKF